MKKKGHQLNNRNNSEFLDSATLNSASYIDYCERFERLALSRFEWINLPVGMNAEFLEYCLYYFGQAALLNTATMGFINTQATSSSSLNLYHLPTQMHCYSLNIDLSRKVFNNMKVPENPEDYGILVQNNWKSIPTVSTLNLYAYRLANVERTCDVNLNAHKSPIIIKTTDKLLLTFQNLWQKWTGNQPMIMADKSLFEQDYPFEVINTNVPYIIDKLQDYKKEIWNEALTFLGINNILVDKKERLITQEANANNELINYNLQSYLLFRKRACDNFNKLFSIPDDKKIDVKIRSDLYNIIKETQNSFGIQRGDEVE